MTRSTLATLLAAGGLLLSGCGTTPRAAAVPPDALTVASVRHTSAPQPAPVWLSRDALPADAHLGDGERALLLEVALREGRVRSVEPAPLELANLRVRIDSRDRRQTVIAIENDTAAALDFELFVSPDGERFRLIPSCAVAGGMAAYERWPESTEWLAIGAIRSVEAVSTRCD